MGERGRHGRFGVNRPKDGKGSASDNRNQRDCRQSDRGEANP
jgi:hypothetical protein